MQYRYTGPQTAMTLADGREVLLFDGSIVDLPEEVDVTQTLTALGRLAPVAPKTAQKPKADKE